MKSHLRFLPLALMFCVLSVRAAEIVDVAVVGATPAGVSAAVSAARMGASVVLLEETDHIGGILSNGLTNSDIQKQQAVAGTFFEFTQRVLKHYKEKDGEASENVKLCRKGYWYEASVAEAIFNAMIAEQGTKIRLILRHRLKRVEKDGETLRAVVMDDLAGGGEKTFAAKVFIDGTYEGDLAGMAGAPYRVGRESRAEYGESHAGKVYAKFGSAELLPGSTGEADAGIQGFCFRAHLTKIPAKRVPIQKPAAFNRDDYRHTIEDYRSGRATKLKQVIQFYPMPNGKFELNSDHPHPDSGVPSESLDLAEENWTWPEANPAERKKLFDRYMSYQVGLLWLLQNDEAIPESVRKEASEWGWCADEWTTNGNIPRQIYVRQGRRILGEYILTQRDGDLDATLKRTRVQPASISIAEFAFDSHGVHKYDPKFPGVREGYIYITHEPLQLPYGILVPKKVDGLLVPVACSASHVGYQAIRMEPVFMALGEASGIAASMAAKTGSAPRAIDSAVLQRELVEKGAVVAFLYDVPFSDPDFAAFQFLCARGWNLGYRAEPDKTPTLGDAFDAWARVLTAEKKTVPAAPEKRDGAVTVDVVNGWLAGAGYAASASKAERMTNREIARMLYAALRPK